MNNNSLLSWWKIENKQKQKKKYITCSLSTESKSSWWSKLLLHVLISVYSLYCAEACNEFAGPIIRVIAPGQHSSIWWNVESRWQHCVRFDRPEIWTSDLPFQRRTRYRSTNLPVSSRDEPTGRPLDQLAVRNQKMIIYQPLFWTTCKIGYKQFNIIRLINITVWWCRPLGLIIVVRRV